MLLREKNSPLLTHLTLPVLGIFDHICKFAYLATFVQLFFFVTLIPTSLLTKHSETKILINIAKIANAVPVTLIKVSLNVMIVVLNCQKCYRVPQKKLSLVEISCGKYNSGWWEIHWCVLDKSRLIIIATHKQGHLPKDAQRNVRFSSTR